MPLSIAVGEGIKSPPV